MKLLIDDANLENIEQISELFPVDGVTTNPTILSKQGENPKKRIIKIREIIGSNKDIHVQAVAEKKSDIIEQAKKINQLLGANTYIKIPAYKQGFKAIEELSEQGIKVTATGIYTPMQAFMAAKAGAKYLAPYVNRIDNLGYDGVSVSLRIQKILDNNNFDCDILAASFKNSNQVLELVENGVGAVTIAPAVFENLIKDYNIDFAIKKFEDDFEKILDGKTSFLELL
ncbi:transaldolase family protein [uncultured Anaerococcus sp.]|uniref:transaldolase family protein n=1 Tax=uncultured Anaerococcus sp. TaxID=293428 RepID=UPI00261A9465|nr:transaldolase family protein [uncultured Anaerococcus sp.]